MEQVGPRAALEPEEIMTALRFSIILAAGGAVLAPLCALGHGMEYLVAKVTLLPEAWVRLEVTADFAQNPMISDETAARDALRDPLRVQEGGVSVPLPEKGRRIERREGWADLAPAAIFPIPEDGAQHDLITATWEWQAAESALVFELPKGRLHDVMLWMDEKQKAKWMLLLPGDQSKAIALMPRTVWWPWLGLALVSVVVSAAWIGRRRRLF